MIKHDNSKVLVAGTLVLDIIPCFDAHVTHERLSAGGTVYLENIQTNLGGLVGNTGGALHRLGADVTLFSRVGTDLFGEMVRDRLALQNITAVIETAADMKTSTSIVISPPGQDRMILHRRGASQTYSAADIPEKLLSEHALFHFGYPTGMEYMCADKGERLSSIFIKAKNSGITTSLDTSFPGLNTLAGKADWYAILGKTLPYVDIFLPSLEEILFMLDKERYLKEFKFSNEKKMDRVFNLDLLYELSDKLLGFGVKVIGIKCGENGFYLRTSDEASFVGFGRLVPNPAQCWVDREMLAPPYSVARVYSTTGAGDTSAAGFLLGMLLGRDPEQTLQLAAGSAASRIESKDGLDGVPHYTQLDGRIGHGWDKLPLTINSVGWEWDKEYGVYNKRP